MESQIITSLLVTGAIMLVASSIFGQLVMWDKNFKKKHPERSYSDEKEQPAKVNA